MSTRPKSTPAPAVVLTLGLVGGLVLALFWFWVSAEGSAVPQSPWHAKVAVVGSPDATTSLAAGLQHGGFRVVAAPTEAKALDLVQHRKVDAIVNVDTNQLQTAQAASNLTALVLPQVLSSPQFNLHLRTSEIKPLAAGDPTSLGIMFICLGTVLSALPAGIALALLMRRRRPSSLADAGVRIGVIVVYAGISALAIAALADGILGYGGTQMLTIWGFGTLMGAAVMGTAVALVGALGLPGVVLSALPFLFFGIPSAPVPSPWDWESTVYRVLGPLDPFGATANGIKNGIFFKSASQAENLWALAAWIAVPAALIMAMGWWSGHRSHGESLAPAMGASAYALKGAA
ncbi:MAG TPA: hypothetical protein VMU14_10295 [Acidimicrobiales bacterium]|nr:hypothetical protein [Acidimicrobiales bacterium]